MGRITFLRASLLLGLGAIAGCAMQTGDEPTGTTEEAAVCATGTTVEGVDVSIYQGTVNWTAVKAAGRDFAIARISDGTGSLDSTFAANWAGIKSAGMVRGAYQYFEPGEDPTAQANIVINAVGMLVDGDLPVTADMEVAGGQSGATIAAHLQTWANAVETGTGKKPMIYTSPGFWNGSVASTAFSSYPLWVANWGPSCPTLPTGWSTWPFWQYSDMGSVSGINATVDLDKFNGTLAQLQAFAGGTPAYAAQYVSQTWPLATTTITMTACSTLKASIVFKNVGTKTWDSKTHLATTQPRDRVSVFADTGWIADNRPAGLPADVAPGADGTFSFDFHAPDKPGSYDEFFGLVEEGVAWFSDMGQGGPADNVIEAKIQVTAGDGGACPVTVGDGGAGDGGVVKGDGGTPAGDSGTMPEPDAASPSSDGGWQTNSSKGNGGGGCACDGAGGNGAFGWAAPWSLALAGGALVRRRRRRV